MTKIPLEKKMIVMPPIPREYLKIPLESYKRLKYLWYLKKKTKMTPKTLEMTEIPSKSKK